MNWAYKWYGPKKNPNTEGMVKMLLAASPEHTRVSESSLEPAETGDGIQEVGEPGLEDEEQFLL